MEALETFQRVYLGVRISKSKGRCYAWANLADAQQEGVRCGYFAEKKQLVGRAVIGGIYRFTWGDKEAGSYYVAGEHAPVYEGMLADTALLVTLQTMHKAALQAHAAEQKERSDGRQDWIEQALRPIKVAYQRASPQERAAIEVLVLKHLWE